MHFKLLQHTLVDLVARIPGTVSTDSNVQGCSVATATGHEHDPTSTVGVVHSSVVPTRGCSDKKRTATRGAAGPGTCMRHPQPPPPPPAFER